MASTGAVGASPPVETNESLGGAALVDEVGAAATVEAGVLYVDCLSPCEPSLEWSSSIKRRRGREVVPRCSLRCICSWFAERVLETGCSLLLSGVGVGSASSASACSFADRRFFLEPEVLALSMRSDSAGLESEVLLDFFMVDLTRAMNV